jgi:hypothetical protein
MTARKNDMIIEYSIDRGETWHHGRTIDARFANDKEVISDQRGHTRAWVRDDHPGVDRVDTRVLDADDPRAEVNRPPSDGKFYAVRQASRKIIGSRLMSRAEADEEVACWAENIGPAIAVPDSPAIREAVRAYDQEVLGEWLYPAPATPKLTPAETSILTAVRASGRRGYNGRATRQLDRLEKLGLLTVDWNADLDVTKSRLRWRIQATPAAPCDHPRRLCFRTGCTCRCFPCTHRPVGQDTPGDPAFP